MFQTTDIVPMLTLHQKTPLLRCQWWLNTGPLSTPMAQHLVSSFAGAAQVLGAVSLWKPVNDRGGRGYHPTNQASKTANYHPDTPLWSLPRPLPSSYQGHRNAQPNDAMQITRSNRFFCFLPEI